MPTTCTPIPRHRLWQLRLKRQGLLDPPPATCTKQTLVKRLHTLGQVQVDPMQVVGRAEHLTFWSRLPAFRPSMLDHLYAPTPRAFEYFTRAAALVPMDVYPLVASVMRRPHKGHYWPRWAVEWVDEHPAVADRVLKAIEATGPMSSREFPDDGSRRKGWGGAKQTKHAMDALWGIGKLMVCARRNGEKVYDLTERVLPPDITVDHLDERERIAQLLERALNAYGVTSPKELAEAYGSVSWPADRKLSAADVLKMAAEQGWPTINIEGTDEPWICDRAGRRSMGRDIKTSSRRMTLLGPFDPAVIHRKVLAQLTGFKYVFEAYTPAIKRRYGPYTMPILWSDQLIGRVDAKFVRKQAMLMINGIWLEPGVNASVDLARALAQMLRGFADFLGASAIELRQATPATLSKRLNKHL